MKKILFVLALLFFGGLFADAQARTDDEDVQSWNDVQLTVPMTKHFDFYTAVDDLKPEDTAGADMLGTIEFNSACFYRYMNVDTDKLKNNLLDDNKHSAPKHPLH